MKKLIQFSLMLISYLSLNAQTPMPVPVPHHKYDQLKQQGALNNGLYFIQQDQSVQPLQNVVQPPVNPQAPANCNCMIPIDATFQIVPFTWGTPPDYRNDDALRL
ncbi:MAG: hypothetical protein Fur0041_19950 [Bacteroidia bacterium]